MIKICYLFQWFGLAPQALSFPLFLPLGKICRRGSREPRLLRGNTAYIKDWLPSRFRFKPLIGELAF